MILCARCGDGSSWTCMGLFDQNWNAINDKNHVYRRRAYQCASCGYLAMMKEIPPGYIAGRILKARGEV